MRGSRRTIRAFRRLCWLLILALSVGSVPGVDPAAALAQDAPAVPVIDTPLPASGIPFTEPVDSTTPTPFLSLDLLVAPDTIAIGDTVAVTITVANSGTDAAYPVTVSLPVPAGVKASAPRIAGETRPAAPVVDAAVPVDVAKPTLPEGAYPAPIDPNPAAQSVATSPIAPDPVAKPTLPIAPSRLGDPVTWEVGKLAAADHAVLVVDLIITAALPGDALVLTPQVTADNVRDALTITGGAPLIAPTPADVVSRVPVGRATTIAGQAGRVQVLFPEKASDQALTVQVRRLQDTVSERIAAKLPVPLAGPGGHRSLGAFELDAALPDGTAVHTFTVPLTLTVRYTPEQLAATNLAGGTLAIFWFNEADGVWQPLLSTIDTKTQTISAPVVHFSPFTLGQNLSVSTAYLPSLQGFQVSGFTGAMSFNLPIETPKGANGHGPALSLSYSSAASDGPGALRRYAQTGWVGKGWSLGGAGSVGRYRNLAGPAYDNFTLSAGGISFDMVRGTPKNGDHSSTKDDLPAWNWNATDEQFATVEAYWDSGSSMPCAPDYAYAQRRTSCWRMWATDGTRYTFGLPLWSVDTNGKYVAQWLLTEVVDSAGNKTTYDYVTPRNTAYPTPAPADDYFTNPFYALTQIAWAYTGSTPAYQVLFDASRRYTFSGDGADPNNWGTCESPQVDCIWDFPQYGSPPSGTDMKFRVAHEAYRLDDIRVLVQGQLARRYHLSYATNAGSLTTDWYTIDGSGNRVEGQKTLTLTSVQLVGSDNATALPATTFTYDPIVKRMTGVNNGQRGTYAISYDEVWPSAAPADTYDNFWRVSQTVRSETSGLAYAASYLTTYAYTGAALNDQNWSAQVYFAKNHPTVPSVSYLAHSENQEFRGHTTVTTRVYADSSTTLLQKTTEWFNQGSPGAACFDLNASCWRGFTLNEATKGRVTKREVSGSGGVLQRTETTYDRIQLPQNGYDPAASNQGAVDTNSLRIGLWRAFIPTVQTVVTTLNGQATGPTQTTQTFYHRNITNVPGNGWLGWNTCLSPNDHGWPTNVQDRPYQYLDLTGNVACVKEFSNDGLVRRTRSTYATPVGTNPGIRNRLSRQVVTDGSGTDGIDATNRGNLLAMTIRLYDAYPVDQTGDKGLLAAERAYDDIPPNTTSTYGTTLHSRDTEYVYDTVGNPTIVRTFTYKGARTVTSGGAESFTALGNAGGVRAATTTGYTGGSGTAAMGLAHSFNQYIIGTETATYDYRYGQLSSLIDVNSAVTNATYDVFGRVASVTKPGTSSGTSASFGYADSEVPVRRTVQLRRRADASGGDPLQETQLYYDGFGQQIATKTEVGDYNSVQTLSYTRFDALGRTVQTSDAQNANTTVSYQAPPGTTQWTTTGYDGLGRTLSVDPPGADVTTMSYSAGSNGGLTTRTTDANSNWTDRESDTLGRLRWVKENIDASHQPVTEYRYDGRDLLLQARANTTNVDSRGTFITSNVYDSLGRKTSTNDPDMGAWSYTYDTNGTLQTQIDARGQTITFGYDVLDRLTARTGPDQAAYFAYDDTYGGNAGKGRRTSSSVWQSGQSQRRTGWFYDARGQVTGTLYTLNTVTGGPIDRQFSTTYDQAGTPITQVYPNTETVTTATDMLGRAKRVCSSFSGGSEACSAASNTGGYLKSSSFNTDGQQTAATYANGLTTTWGYESDSKRLSSIGGPLQRSYQYHANGNIAYQTRGSGTFAERTYYGYDGLNRLTVAASDGTGLYAGFYDNADLTSWKTNQILPQPTQNWGTGSPDPSVGPDTFSSRWTAQLQVPFPVGTNKTYTFCVQSDDGAKLFIDGTLLIDRWSAAPGETCGTIDLDYGNSTLQLEYAEQTGSASASITWQGPSFAKQVIQQKSLEPVAQWVGLKAEYFSNVTLSGTPTTWNWTTTAPSVPATASPATGVPADGYSVRWTGTIQTRAEGNYTFCPTTDDGVRLWVNNTQVVQNWRDQGATARCGELYLGAHTRYTFRMEYVDFAGGAEATLRWSGPGFGSEVIPVDRFRIPDGTPNKQIAWVGYDVLGNLTGKGGLWVGSYGTQSASCPAGALSKPHAVVGTGASTWQSICYDQNGNMVSGGGRTITWNSDNLPSQVDSGKIVETYGYDADGARMVTVSGAITTIDLGGVWQEQLGTGLSNNPYTLAYSANGQAIAVRNGSFNLGGGTVTYLHSDNLGSASAVSNASGAIINTATYDPWGQVVEGGVPQTDKGYTGQQRDDTGLMWYQSRLYDPNLGRFLSADTIVPGSGALTIWPSDSTASASWSKLTEGGTANPQELNRYSYVNNNPMGSTDPTGHCMIAEYGGGAAGDCPMQGDAWVMTRGSVSASVAIVSTYVVSKVLQAHSIDDAASQVNNSDSVTKPIPLANDVPGSPPDRTLPRNKDGINERDSPYPHTQLGVANGSKGKYRQTREWDEKGIVKDTDWTDHGRKDHPNPHDHYYEPNPTGGTPRRGPAVPVKPVKE